MSYYRNTTVSLLLSLTLLCVLALTHITSAAPSYTMNYQGKLTTAANVAVPNGTYNMRFWLLSSSTVATTSALWTESLTGTNRVQVTNGLFSVMLGSTSPLTSVDFNQTLYLGVEIGSTTGSAIWDGEMSPRKILGTVPSAFEAKKLNGLNSTQLVRNDATSSIATTSADTMLTITQNGAGDLLKLLSGTTNVFSVLNSGYVGVGSTSPVAKFSVAGNSYFGGNVTATGTVTFTNTTSGILVANSTGVLSASTTIGTGYLDTTVLLSSEIDTSSELAGILSDETGTGLAVFSASPTFTGGASFAGINVSASSTLGYASSTALSVAGNAYITTALGIGTSTPTAKFALTGTAGQTSSLFRISSSTEAILFDVLADGSVDIGQGGIYYNASTDETTISNLNFGAMTFAPDSGAVIWVDMQSSSTPLNGILSYTATIDGNSVFTVYGESDGAGGVKNLRVGVGSSTPNATLTVQGLAQADVFRAASTTATSTFGEVNFAGAQSIRDSWMFWGGQKFMNASSTAFNTYIGLGAGTSTQTGSQNTGVGYYTLQANTTGNFNTALGAGVLQSTISGSVNTAVGHQAMQLLVSGDYNTAVGAGALKQGVSGDYNTAIGSNALGDANLGSSNTVLGDSTMRLNITGSDNTAIGRGALYGNLTGLQNTALGRYALGSYNGTGTIGIGYQAGDALTGGVHNIIIGYNNDFTNASTSFGLNIGNIIYGTNIDGEGTTFSSGNIGIGTSTPAQKLSVAGGMHLTGGLYDRTYNVGTNGMVLQTTGSGVQWVATSSLGISSGSSFTDSAGLATILSDETGTGFAVFSNAPTFTGTTAFNALTVSATSTLGYASSTALTVSGNTYLSYASSTGMSGTNLNFTNGYFNFASSSYASTTGLTATNAYILNALGIGTTTPTAKFALTGTAGQTSSLFRLSSSTESILFDVLADGSVDIGQGGIYYNASTDETTIANLNLGASNFETDGGAVNWVDMQSSSTPLNGILSYTATIDGNSVFTVYGESDGAGGVKNLRVGIGSTTPTRTLSVAGDSYFANNIFSASSTLGYASTTALTVSGNTYLGGNVAVGTPTPWAKFTVLGSTGSDLTLLDIASTTGSATSSFFNVQSNGMVIVGATSSAVQVSQFLVSNSTTGSIGIEDRSVADMTSGRVWRFQNYQGDFRIQDVWTDNVMVFKKTTNNVGIGTTTPAQKLSVAGGMHLTGGLYDRTYNVGTNGMVLQTTGSGVQWVATSTLGLSATGDGSSNWLYNGSRLSPSTTVGIGIFASSTIGGGTGATGLTINGGATTTGNAYFGGTLGIGTTTPSATLALVGSGQTNLFAFASSTGSNLLTLDGRGVLVFGTTTSADIYLNGGATSSVVQGNNNNIAIGNKAFSYYNVGGGVASQNIALGSQALYGSSSVLMTGDNNVALGQQALFGNTSGYFNNAIGPYALYTNSSGGQNNALGGYALYLNTTGNNNNASGYSSLYNNISGSENNASGYFSLYANTIGSYNNAFGTNALRSNISGSFNNALGYNAGYNMTTGTSTTFLGAMTDTLSGSISSSTALGAGALLARSNTMVLGGTGANSVDIVTGTSTPWAKFSIQNNYGSTTALFDIATTTSSAFATSSIFRVNHDGRVGIGTTTPQYSLDVYGTARAQSLITNALVLTSSSTAYSTLSSYGGYNGYISASGGFGTGGSDSVTPAQRLTVGGNLVNIGSVQAGELSLTSGGTFAAKTDYSTGAVTSPWGIDIGDINGDGKLDMVTSNYSPSTISALLNNGSGGFAAGVQYSVGDTPYGLALGDVNGDGKLDVVSVNGLAPSISVLMNNGNGTFATKVDYTTNLSPRSVDIGDINGDGKADIVVGNYGSNNISVFLNNGNGTFASRVDYTTGSAPNSVVISDVNGDGKSDVITGNWGSGVTVHINNGNGTFATGVDYTAGAITQSIAVGDINGDGKSDIVAANGAGSDISVFINNGNGTFAAKVDYVVGGFPYGIALGDMNGDGKSDLAVANSASTTVSILLNNGNGTFASKVDYTTGASPRGVVIGDMNGDGKADLGVSSWSTHTVAVFLNVAKTSLFAQASTGNVVVGTSSPWAKFAVQGTLGSTDAIFDVATTTSAGYATSSILRVNHNGRVGIGTSSPYANLTVAGTMGLTGAFYDRTASAGTNGMVLQTTGSGVQWVATSSLGISSGSSFTDSAGLATILSDETGTGLAVFSASPTFTGGARFTGINVSASSTLAYASSTALTVSGNSYFNFASSTNASTTGLTASNAYVLNALGIGTSTPTAKFALTGTAGQTSSLFRLSSSTESILFDVLADGSVDIGQGGIYYNASTDETTIANLNLGATNFDVDAGEVSWVDMQASGTPINTKLSYTATLDSNPVFTVYGESNGAGGVQNLRVGIGSTSPNATLTVQGLAQADVFRAASTTATSTFGEVNFAGAQSARDSWMFWGGQKFVNASSTAYNTYVGLGAGTSTINGGIANPGYNTGIGYQSLQANTSGISNTGIGYQSLFSNTTGRYNVGLGTNALNFNTTGSGNIAVGVAALLNNTSGGSNIGQGYWSLFSNTTGSRNIALGEYAMFANTTGSSSVAIGLSALGGNTTGASSTALGIYAGYTNQTGYNNTYLGDESDSLTNALSNATAIGSHAKVGASNSLVLGGTGAWGVKVGIGTTTPWKTLSVVGDMSLSGAFFDSASTSGSNGMVLKSTGSGAVWVATSTLGLGGGGSSNWVDNGAYLSTLGAGDGISVSGSSTIGAGTGSTGLTINGGATTTGNAYFGGYVGIGTSTPTSTLTLVSSNNINSGSNLTNGVGGLAIRDTTSIGLLFDTNQIEQMDETNSLYLNYNSRAKTVVNVGGGFVGIGTVAPTGVLTVASSTSSTTLEMLKVTNGTNPFTVLGNGYVGIGTATPAYGLDVYMTGSAALRINNPTASGYTQMLYTGTGRTWQTGVGNASETALGVANKYYVYDGSGGGVRMVIDTNGNIGVGTTTPWAKLSVQNSYGATSALFDIATTTSAAYATSSLFRVAHDGRVSIGSTTPESLLLTLQKTGITGAGIYGIKEYLGFTNSTESAVYYGDNAYIVNAPTATSTLIGKIIRIEDSTSLGNTVRGLEVQAHKGTNTKGENTAISGYGRTFGVKGTTEGDAGSTARPAGVFAESRGTTLGNALRVYSGSLTTEALVSFSQDTSVFAGTGLLMNFGNSGGSFASTTSKFLDLQNSGTSKFTVTAQGTTTIGDGTTANMAGLQIGYGGLCVDNDGSCTASTTGRITSVSSATGNSDLAEMYFSEEALTTGDIIALRGGLSIGRADTKEDTVIGVVSTKPGLVMGFDDSSLTAGQTGYPVALKGRVPVRLSTENGPIVKGDRITLSSIAGVGMKATESSTVVGIALEDWDGETAYTTGFINQFGDDLAKAKTTPINQNLDTRTQDGCYEGGGVETGDKPCTPDKVKAIKPKVVTPPDYATALNELKTEEAVATTTKEGTEVQIGQALMFVQLAEYTIPSEQDILTALNSTSTLLNGNGTETLFDRIKALANAFVDGVLRIAGVHTDELCVGNVCVDEATFLRMVENAGAGNTATVNDGTGDDGADDDTTTGDGQIDTLPEGDTDTTPDTTVPPTEDPGSSGTGPTPEPTTPPVVEETPAPEVTPTSEVAPEPTPEPEPAPETASEPATVPSV